MEWDQIAANWAAMARRLCSDRPTQYPRTIGGVQDTGRAATGTGGGMSGDPSSERAPTTADVASHQ